MLITDKENKNSNYKFADLSQDKIIKLIKSIQRVEYVNINSIENLINHIRDNPEDRKYTGYASDTGEFSVVSHIARIGSSQQLEEYMSLTDSPDIFRFGIQDALMSIIAKVNSTNFKNNKNREDELIEKWDIFKKYNVDLTELVKKGFNLAHLCSRGMNQKIIADVVDAGASMNHMVNEQPAITAFLEDYLKEHDESAIEQNSRALGLIIEKSNINPLVCNITDTPLGYALFVNRLDLASILESHGADPYLNSAQKETMFSAIYSVESAQWLMEKAPDLLYKTGPNRLSTASNLLGRNNAEVIKYLIVQGLDTDAPGNKTGVSVHEIIKNKAVESPQFEECLTLIQSIQARNAADAIFSEINAHQKVKEIEKVRP